MADIVNLRVEEYELIQSELSNMHTTQILALAEAIELLKELASDKDIFYANHTTGKIVEMLEIFSSDVVNLMQRAFWSSEVGVANMIATVVTTDTAVVDRN